MTTFSYTTSQFLQEYSLEWDHMDILLNFHLSSGQYHISSILQENSTIWFPQVNSSYMAFFRKIVHICTEGEANTMVVDPHTWASMLGQGLNLKSSTKDFDDWNTFTMLLKHFDTCTGNKFLTRVLAYCHTTTLIPGGYFK